MYDIWSVDVPMQRWPLANWFLILFIAISSAAAWNMQKPQDTRRLDQLMREVTDPGKSNSSDKHDRVTELMREIDNLKARNSVPGTLHPQAFHWYQLITSILVHANLAHLLGNLFFLFVFGNAINDKLGHGWYLLCFFTIGMLENALWLLIGDGRSSLGASAAIMGIVGLFLVFYPRNDIKMVWWFYGIEVDHYYISAFWIILLYVGLDLIGALWFGNAGIGFLAHLVGAFAGFLLGIIALHQGWIEPVYEEENLLQTLGFQEKLCRHDL